MTIQTSAAVALFESGDMHGAAAEFQKMIDNGDRSAAVRYGLAVCLLRLGDTSRAEATLNEVLEIDRDHDNAHYYLGRIAEQRGDAASAEAAYRRALAVNPGHKAARQAVDRMQVSATVPAATASPRPRILAEDLDDSSRLEDLTSVEPGELVHTLRRLPRSCLAAFLPAVVFLVIGLLSPRQPSVIVTDTTGWGGFASALETAGFQVGHAALWWALIAAALAAAWGTATCLTTRFDIYEHRIDSHIGIFWRRHQACWTYDIVAPPRVTQNPVQVLTDCGTVVIQANGLSPNARDLRVGRSPVLRLAGVGGSARCLSLAEELRARSLRERRGMYKHFM